MTKGDRRTWRVWRQRYVSGATVCAVLLLQLVLASGSGTPRGAASEYPSATRLWVEDNNLGYAGGMTPDFTAMFSTKTEAWAKARTYISVYVLRATTLRKQTRELTDDFLRDDFLPHLKEWQIELALDVTGATWAGCGDRRDLLFSEAAAVARIQQLGGEVRYLSLQSPLSKPATDCPAYDSEGGTALRIADIVRYIAFMKKTYPGIQIGLIDALPAKCQAYQAVYQRLVDALAWRDLSLDYLHLDLPIEFATADWAHARAAEEFVRHELGVRFGLTYTTRDGGRTSNAAFHAGVLAAQAGFTAAGGGPDDIFLTSWYPYPSHNLPEDAATDFPFMRTVLAVATNAAIIPRSFPAGATPIAQPS